MNSPILRLTFSLLILFLGSLTLIPQAQGAVIFTNPITGSNPNTDNPYTTGQSFDPNIIVSGIGRGTGIAGTNSNDRYNATGWNSGAFDVNDYFTFTLTPTAAYEIDFTSFVFTGQASGTGPTSFAFRSSLDGFATDIGTPTASGATIDLSGASFQNILGAIEFRLYAWGASAGTGTFSVNDFTFNGDVNLLGFYWIGNDTTLGGPGTWDAATTSSWSATNSDGGPAVAWDSSKRAVFGGSGDTVTVSGTVTAGAGIEFQSTDYTITGGDAINLAGANAAANPISTASGVTATIETHLTGTNGMTKTGAGTLVLTGDKTYTGGTTISGGILQLGDGTTNGSVAGNIANNATLAFNNGSAQTFGGDITGAGALIKDGAGNLTLSGTNTYSGGTTVNAGTLSGTTTSLQGAITNNAAVTFDQATSGTYAGVMSGSGSLTKTGTGNVTLSGANSYGGGTTVSGGILTGTTSSLQGAITNNAAVTFDQATNGTYAGVMSGSGSLTKTGTGTVTLSGANSYGGGTTVSGGILTGTTTSLQGAITNNAAVTFDQATNGTYAGTMNGSGSLTKTGAGQVTLTGSNGYSGGTTINGGTVVAASNSALGTAAVTMTGSTLLASPSVTVANAIVVQANSGTPTVIAYWNFNDLSIATQSPPGSGGVPTSIASSIGSASLSLASWAGNVDDFAGTTLNALNSDPAEESLSLIRAVNGNGSFIQISGLNLTGYTDLQISYASQRSGEGFNSNQWSYSTNGTSFTNFGSAITPTTGSFGLVTTPTTVGLQNASSGFLRYTLTGASEANGNNRIDNLQILAVQELPSTLGSSTSGSSTFSGNITLNGSVLLTAATGGTSLFTGVIADGSNGARGIEKVGAGVVEVTGANTYSGPTTVTAGTLAVTNTTGSGTGTGNVLVKNSAVLAGTGTLRPAAGGSIVLESGSTVSVGSGGASSGQQLSFIPDSGTITTTFMTGSSLEFDLFSNAGDNSSISAAADRLFLNGAAVFEPNVTLRVNTALDSLLFAEGNTWKLLDWGSLSITGDPNDLDLELPTLSGSLSWNTSQLFSTGNITIVPEPSRALLVGVGLLALVFHRRRMGA